MSASDTHLPPSALAASLDQPATILIIDDAQDGRETLRTLLAGQGYRLAFAASGPDGLACAADLIPDLILLDVMMPGMDGFEVCRRLRANPLLAEVPVILITALEDRQSRLKGIEAGADDFISKYLDSTELRARVRTITRLNRHRRMLIERAKFERVVELSPNGLLLIDADGMIALINPALLSMLGATRREDLLGKPLLSTIAPAGYDKFAASLRRAIAEPAYTGRFEAELVRLDGTRFPAEVDVGHFAWGGGAHAQVIVRDITERKLLEARLLQAQKMESIGRLAGGVAHDFNNLLTAISGYASLALETLPADAPEREDLAAIQKAGASAANLTRQLLAFARKQLIEPRVLDLNDLILDMEKLLRRLIGEDIELVSLAAPGLGLVKADPGQIEQVIVNLAINARDAMPRGGRLTIETANLAADEAYIRQRPGMSTGEYVLLVVCDNGIGMDEATHAHIFEPFFTTKEAGRGTGLGLATCYGIIKQHGGHIWATSELGGGTSFRIYLPRVEGHAQELPGRGAASSAPRGDELVLLAEDDPAVRGLAARVLRGLGYTVIEASDGTEALKLAQPRAEATIDLLLTDVVMPKMGGAALAEHMLLCYPAMAVLFMSGYAENGASSDMPVLQKPFTPQVLARRVREVLDARRAGQNKSF